MFFLNAKPNATALATLLCLLPADQVDIHLLRCQQLRLYILKAGRALLSHQDRLRQILCQPAVVDMGPNPSGKISSRLVWPYEPVKY